MEPVVLYATSACPECERAARTLGSLGIPYKKRLIAFDPASNCEPHG